jgi:DNA-directed RNA polymerase subunit RPC12/RpoP
LELLQEEQELSSEEPNPEEQERAAEEQAKAEEEREKELNDIILELVKKAEDEDKDLRQTPLNIWKRNELYFNNIQSIFLDPVAHDYRTLNSILEDLAKEGANLDIKVINIYRAYIESIVAALSVDIPNVEFAPDDPDNPDDVETSATYEKISVVLQRRNHAALMLVKGLTKLCNQGVVFGRSYRDNDPKYGMYNKAIEHKQVEQKVIDARCSNCGELLDSGLSEQEIGPEMMISCPECSFRGMPDLYPQIMYVNEPVKWENTPKGQTKFEILGPTFVKFPIYARDQFEGGYLIYRYEGNIHAFQVEYQNFELQDKHDSESYERWARLPIEYNNEVPQHIATKREAWFRPKYYATLGEEKYQILVNEYPDGFKCCVIGDTVVSKKIANLDDEWTISIDPRADFVHAEPLGNTAVPIQDAENDTFNLGLQCIEYGVPETFAHPKTLNFEKYSNSKASPGMVSPAVPYSPDKSLADGFHTIKTATLSSEYSNFEKGLESKGQFVTGAMASIFGGAPTAGSRTADEYRQSNARALQRLQIPLRMIRVFWSDMIYKCVVDYAKNMREDEKHTDKKAGTYVSIWISKSSLNGKAGQVTPDLNEQLPLSWAQKRDFISSMIEKSPEMAGTILMHPNNADLLKSFTGINEIYIPGEHDVHKQTVEFQQIVSGLEVPIDVFVDDHSVHKLVLKDILVSPIGMGLDEETYARCIKHYQEHEAAEQAKMQAPAGKMPPGEAPPSAIESNEGV